MTTESARTPLASSAENSVALAVGRDHALAPAAAWLAAIRRGVRWLFALGAVLLVAVYRAPFAAWLGEHLSLVTLVLPIIALHILAPLVEFRRRSWCLREHDFVTRSGLFTRQVVSIPLARIQQVDLNSGMMDRWLGITGLQIHSAGSQAARVDVPGLEPGLAAALQARLTKLGDQLAR